jgi:hypothetical protein
MNKREVILRLQGRTCNTCGLRINTHETYTVEYKGLRIERPSGIINISCGYDVTPTKFPIKFPDDWICEHWSNNEMV